MSSESSHDNSAILLPSVNAPATAVASPTVVEIERQNHDVSISIKNSIMLLKNLVFFQKV